MPVLPDFPLWIVCLLLVATAASVWLVAMWWNYQWIYPLEYDAATRQVRQHKVRVRRQRKIRPFRCQDGLRLLDENGKLPPDKGE